MPLFELDKSPDAILNPSDVQPRIEGFPPVAVGTFSGKLLKRLEGRYGVFIVDDNKNVGKVLAMRAGEVPVAVFAWKLGAPACAATLEEVYAMGAKAVVAFGSCGALDASLEDGQLVIPTSAVREEGTSYQYIPPSEEIAQDERSIAILEAVFRESGVPYTMGKTWTTDAIYRETRDKVAMRRKQGCICVEMECSALLAVAQFRKKRFAQFLFASDNLDAPAWQSRGLLEKTVDERVSAREIQLTLALDCAQRLARELPTDDRA